MPFEKIETGEIVFLSLKSILQLINFSSIRSTRTEITLAKVVLSIVFIFVVCQIPRIYLAFYRVSEKYTYPHNKYLIPVLQSSMSRRTNMCWSLGLLPAHPSWMFTLTAVQHFALILNSSINFVVYCAMGTKYATLNSFLYLYLQYACKYLI